MPLVADASVALAWALPDESSPYADADPVAAMQALPHREMDLT